LKPPYTPFMVQAMEVCERTMATSIESGERVMKACHAFNLDKLELEMNKLNATFAHEYNMMVKKAELNIAAIEAKTNATIFEMRAELNSTLQTIDAELAAYV